MANNFLDLSFSALGDPTRRAIVEQLAGGEATVGALAEPFDMALPTISRHLKVLERARLIARRVNGRQHWIRLRPESLRAVTDWLEFHQRFWAEGLDRIDAALTEEAERPNHHEQGEQQ